MGPDVLLEPWPGTGPEMRSASLGMFGRCEAGEDAALPSQRCIVRRWGLLEVD